jgi:lipopolysaccharide export system protein LptA
VRFTIERIRTLVLIAGALVLVALMGFLWVGKWKSRLNRRDLPQRLGVNIQQEANGYTYVHAFGAHSQYKIHASKEVQLKDNRVELHDVEIELYGQDGKDIDRIAGDKFEYDEKSGVATADGKVDMLLTQPASAQEAGGKEKRLPSVPAVSSDQIRLKTSGVTFDRNSGMVTTRQRVDFSMKQGFGSAIGAQYDSQSGYLTLQQAVQLTTYKGRDAVEIHAQHAEIDRGAQLCLLRAATADYRGGQAGAAQVKLLFRTDGSAARLDAIGGFTLTTAAGGRLAAPTGWMEFDEHNQPRHGHMEGGVSMDSVGAYRTVHGTSPTVDLEFTAGGQLRHAHLETGVAIESEEKSQGANAQATPLQLSRTWRSPVADVDFRNAGQGRVEPAAIHGTGGVTITSESQRGNEAAAPSKVTADEVTGAFGPDSVLRSLTGVGHAGIEQSTATGTRQTASGDRLRVEFTPQGAAGENGKANTRGATKGGNGAPGANELQSAELDGHVAFFEQAAAKPGAQLQPAMRAWAGKAVYERTGEWLHLTLNPRVEDGGLELTANKVDVSQQSGDAFAHGNVKATWIGQDATAGQSAGQGNVSLGGQGPAHVIAEEAQLHQSAGEATFRGHARLWQQANSVAGPLIVLDRQKQTLVVRTTDSADPVKAVLLSVSATPGKAAAQPSGQNGGNAAGKPATPSVIRVRGGDLWYSDVERRAVMYGGVLGAVVAETGTATSTSNEVELQLTPAGNRDSNNGGQAQVDRMTAMGRVMLTSQGRRGTGEQLVYSGATGDYVLTGTASAPPRMSDPERGSVSGEALIFHSRDDSVSIEGGGRETTTETTAPRAQRK